MNTVAKKTNIFDDRFILAIKNTGIPAKWRKDQNFCKDTMEKKSL